MNSEHPLSEDLTQLSDDDLAKRHNELSRRWQIARRMNMNPQIMHQLDIMLNGIEAERSRRIQMPESSNTVVLETDPLIVSRENR